MCPALTGRIMPTVILTAPPGSGDCAEDSGAADWCCSCWGLWRGKETACEERCMPSQGNPAVQFTHFPAVESNELILLLDKWIAILHLKHIPNLPPPHHGLAIQLETLGGAYMDSGWFRAFVGMVVILYVKTTWIGQRGKTELNARHNSTLCLVLHCVTKRNVFTTQPWKSCFYGTMYTL